MALIIQQTLPADVPIQMLDAVTAEMGVDSDPPTGLIVHTHYEKDGRVHVLDVWDSAEHQSAFAENRLRPAMAKVAADNGIDIAQYGPPEFSTTEVHAVVRGG